MYEEYMVQGVSLLVIFVLILTNMLTKKLHYFVGGVMLITLGTVPLLYENYVIDFHATQYKIFHYAAYALIGFATHDLFSEGLKEKTSSLKYPTLVFASVFLIVKFIELLHSLDIIPFKVNYPPVVDHIIYIVAGVLLLVGIFTLLATKE